MHLSAHALVLQVVYWKARLAVNHTEALPAVEALMLMCPYVENDLVVVLLGFASPASQAALLHTQPYLQQCVKSVAQYLRCNNSRCRTGQQARHAGMGSAFIRALVCLAPHLSKLFDCTSICVKNADVVIAKILEAHSFYHIECDACMAMDICV